MSKVEELDIFQDIPEPTVADLSMDVQRFKYDLRYRLERIENETKKTHMLMYMIVVSIVSLILAGWAYLKYLQEAEIVYVNSRTYYPAHPVRTVPHTPRAKISV